MPDTRPTAQLKKDDLIESTIGSFGKWQCRISICMALLKFPVAWFQLGIIFLAPPTDFWCRQPEDFKIMSVQNWIELIAPFKNETNYIPSSSKCMMRNIELPKDTKLQGCKWGYDYNRSVIHSSIITDWNLVCGKEHFVDIAQMTVMLGILLGNLMFGFMADKYGRKITLIICILMQSICGILSSWTPWFSIFLAIRFFMALANGGTMIVSFVLCMEIVGGKWRSIVSVLYHIPFGVGNTIMAGFAYRFRDWRELQLALSLTSGLYVIYIWMIPESPRWLMVTGKRTKAGKILENAAIYNGQDISKLRSSFLSLPKIQPNKNSNILDLLKISNLRDRTVLLNINWFIAGLTFYGFSTYLGQITTNIYIMVSIAGLITIPGIIICIFLIKLYGRKRSLIYSYVLITASFFSINFAPTNFYIYDWPRMVIAALGVMGLSISMPALYLYTGELFPTTLRNVGVGSSIMFSRIGSLLSSFVVSLKDLDDNLPLLVLGALTMIQLMLLIPLPDSGEILPETVDDIELEIINNNDIMNKEEYLPVSRKIPEEAHDT